MGLLSTRSHVNVEALGDKAPLEFELGPRTPRGRSWQPSLGSEQHSSVLSFLPVLPQIKVCSKSPALGGRCFLVFLI